jgi:hypothetical protein
VIGQSAGIVGSVVHVLAKLAQFEYLFLHGLHDSGIVEEVPKI